MKIIGLAGGSGSGKSTVCKLFSKEGFAFINTDEVYHGLTSRKTPCLDDLVHEFGREILNSDNSLNREKLGQLVFAIGAEEKPILKFIEELDRIIFVAVERVEAASC